MGERHLGRVGREQVDMVLLSVELGQGRSEVRAHLRHDLFAQVEHLRVGHATAVLDGFTFAFDGGGVLTVDGADVVIGAVLEAGSNQSDPPDGRVPMSADQRLLESRSPMRRAV